jgi:NADPH:quinone reductase-like Zn-dependent oxidoreductase
VTRTITSRAPSEASLVNMPSQNIAAIQPAEKTNVEVRPLAIPEPGPHDILIKNQSIAFNPLEWKVQRLALFPLPYPFINGYSFAGTVEKVGSSVTMFKSGDRVAAKKNMAARTGNEYGAYQRYVLCQQGNVAKLPDEVVLDEAASVMLNLPTAVGALNIVLGLERPSLGKETASAKSNKLLVYGGSSSVGQFAIQIASQAGYTVVTTSSPRNMDQVRPLGATKIVDHTKAPEKVVEQLAAEGPYAYIFDTIALPTTTSVVAQVMAANIKAGGTGSFQATMPDVQPFEYPAGVEKESSSYAGLIDDVTNKAVGRWFYEELVPKGLASGRIVPPRIEKMKGGLSRVQEALDRMMKGVSGVKLVVDPWEE